MTVSVPHTCTANLQSKSFDRANLHRKYGANSSILGFKLFSLDAIHNCRSNQPYMCGFVWTCGTPNIWPCLIEKSWLSRGFEGIRYTPFSDKPRHRSGENKTIYGEVHLSFFVCIPTIKCPSQEVESPKLITINCFEAVMPLCTAWSNKTGHPPCQVPMTVKP